MNVSDDGLLRLQDDVLAAITAAQADDGASATEPAARIRRKLLTRIAESEAAQVAVAPEGGVWKPFGPGVEIKVLHRHEGVMSYLLKMAPGAELPNHRHPHDEECVVVEGRVQMGDLSMGPGGYLMERQGTLHPPLRSVDGAIIFLRGAVPKADQLV